MSDAAEPPKPSWEEIENERRREVGLPPVKSASTPPSKARHRVRSLVEWAIAIGGAILVAWAIQAFLFQAFVIPSASMEPTLTNRDRVLVNKRYGTIHAGDVIVFKRPPDIEMGEIDDLIKRVIGVGGDIVEARDGVVIVNGVPQVEPYLAPGAITEDFGPVEVPPGHLFMMGDNRGVAMSFDSRFFGPIPEDLVVGRAFVVIWPVSRLSSL